MNDFFDRNNVIIQIGDVINLHQTVNGENIFVVVSLEPLVIKYGYDLMRDYEYDKMELLSPSKLTNETEYEIISNLYKLIEKYR